MLLPPNELDLFFRLHRTLMFFVNQRLEVIPDKVASPEAFSRLAPDERITVRDALIDNLALIELFVAENPARWTEEELDIVGSWRHLVAGSFYVFRELKQHTVFLATNQQSVAYGVLALSQSFEDLIGPTLPVLARTVLLPFKGRIVYDGLITRYNFTFGPGMRRNLNEDFKDAKALHGIVTSLPISDSPVPPKARKAKSIPKPSKDEKDESLAVIVGLTDSFCQVNLNEEYAAPCRKMAEKLSRKRPSPLLQGSPNAWASGIVRAVGGVNFLHDKSQTPYMRSTDIDYCLGTSPSSGAVKLAAIRKMLKIRERDPNWTLPSRLEADSTVWMFQVNGIVLDIRHAPRAVQEVAFKKGLIPYIPADRLQGE